MQAEAREERKRKAIGGAATLLYAGVWVALMFLVSFRTDLPEKEGEGILIDFGSTETGSGQEDLPMSEEVAETATAAPSDAAAPEETATQETEEAPAVVPPSVPKPKPETRPTERPQPAPQPNPPVEKPREVNKKALFPGRSDSRSTSEGVSGGDGNQGNPAGSPAGDHAGTGSGTSGVSYSLQGRSLVGDLPKPEYAAREEGRVVIEIKVDQQGRVVGAAFRSVGSTTTNSVLVDAARRAALQARFNVDENAPFPQVGTIVYLFRMN